MDAPLKRAFGAAAGMQTIEKLTDADIAEVYQSKNLFEGIESMTSELTGLLNLVHATEWVEPKTKPKNNIDLATVQAWTKGSFGDPVKLATGATKLVIPSSPVETEMEKAKREMKGKALFNEHETATKLSTWLPEINARIETEHYLHWQVVFPGIWHSWESAELHGGFDAVIGNPPYVRQELIKSIKPGLKRSYPDTFAGSADLYIYFYDQGLKLLKPGGRLSFVVTNKWMRAGYAEGLRDVFANKAWIEFVADFGHAKKFFPDADVFPSVIVVRKPDGGCKPADTDVCVIPRDDVPEKALDEAVAKATYALPLAHFTRTPWSLEPPDVVRLLQKIERSGQKLKAFANVEPCYGVKTGLNEAFLIDTPTRNELIRQHPPCEQVIKRYVRGQDFGRWTAPWDGTYMIFARRGINIDSYPSIKRHLSTYKTLLEPRPAEWRPTSPEEEWRGRKPGNYAWYEIQDAVDYWQLMEKPKILYPDIAWTSSFSIDLTGVFPNNTGYFIPTGNPWFVAVLNAPVGWWYAWRRAQHAKDEALRYFNTFVEEYPIPPAPNFDVAGIVSTLSAHATYASASRKKIHDWLQHEWGVTTLSRSLLNCDSLEARQFIESIKDALPRKKRISAGDIAELNREYAATIEPVRVRRDETFGLEQRLSNLVNEAYGLTAAEIDLMWHTAPPRMPFTPTGLNSAVVPEPSEDGEEESTNG